MTIAEQVATIAHNARQASFALARLSTTHQERDAAADGRHGLEAGTADLIAENAKDLAAGREKGLSEAMLDRLMLDETRIKGHGRRPARGCGACRIRSVKSTRCGCGRTAFRWARCGYRSA